MTSAQKDTWFKLFIVLLGILVSVAGAAGGYVYGNLNDDIVGLDEKFETHRMNQFADELLVHQKLTEIEVIQKNQIAVLEEIRDALKERQ